MAELPFCACGCGQRVAWLGNTYLAYHHLRGSANPFFGKTHTDAVKQRISDANAGKTPRLGKTKPIETASYSSIHRRFHELKTGTCSECRFEVAIAGRASCRSRRTGTTTTRSARACAPHWR